MALVQQTIEHTYKFTGRQRECSFVPMCSCFGILPIIESFVFRCISDNAGSSLDQKVSQVTIACFAHMSIFTFKLTGVIRVPDDSGIFGQSVIALEVADRADLGKNAGGIDRTNTGNGVQDQIFLRIQALDRFVDCLVDRLEFLLKCVDAVEG